MRTTVTIPDDLLRRAKQLAAERSCTLSDVVREALQKVFSQPRSGGRRRRTRLTTFRGRGVLPGVDLDSSASLLDAMEGR
jgi:Arc/MetJ-type ribon-helix-helix transcriptional regulator